MQCYSLILLISSKLAVLKNLYTCIKIAKATAASAAATTITNKAKVCPCNLVASNWLNATKFILEAFKISSIPMSTTIIFRLEITKTMPTQNKKAANKRTVMSENIIFLQICNKK